MSTALIFRIRLTLYLVILKFITSHGCENYDNWCLKYVGSTNYNDGLSQCKSQIGNDAFLIHYQANLINKLKDINKSSSNKIWLGYQAIEDQNVGDSFSRPNYWSWSLDHTILYEQGCFQDNSIMPDLDSKYEQILPTQIDPTTCGNICRLKGNKVAGIQNDGGGNICFCSDKYGRYGATSSYYCTIECVTSKKGNCGGAGANIVFYVDGALSKWKKNQPDGSIDSGSACAFTTKNDKLEMSDDDCTSLKGVLCQNGLDTFIYSSTKLSWCEAQNECLKRDMNLIHLNSTEAIENTTAYLDSYGLSGNEEFWVGATRQSWKINGIDRYLTYSNWSVCQPTENLNKVDKACVAINLETGEWTTEKCSENYGVICATDYVTTTNEPTSTPTPKPTTKTTEKPTTTPTKPSTKRSTRRTTKTTTTRDPSRTYPTNPPPETDRPTTQPPDPPTDPQVGFSKKKSSLNFTRFHAGLIVIFVLLILGIFFLILLICYVQNAGFREKFKFNEPWKFAPKDDTARLTANNSTPSVYDDTYDARVDAVKPQSQIYNESAVQALNGKDAADSHRDNPVIGVPTESGAVLRYETKVRRISIRNNEVDDALETVRSRYSTEA
ncbi:DgyrCDS5907 [Dimorphilus gyrociliatus]|uniref:DgyrCDS5907 n=1 Tax=Dimorphilus gyrociliatus TaxID=2664684 RepID=A0A7I8VMZ2_9ANNE|nr:DgyrCDS5907 [Dimorphilus gyrociliatus]